VACTTQHSCVPTAFILLPRPLAGQPTMPVFCLFLTVAAVLFTGVQSKSAEKLRYCTLMTSHHELLASRTSLHAFPVPQLQWSTWYTTVLFTVAVVFNGLVTAQYVNDTVRVSRSFTRTAYMYHVYRHLTKLYVTSTKGTMDPEGTRLLTYSNICLQ